MIEGRFHRNVFVFGILGVGVALALLSGCAKQGDGQAESPAVVSPPAPGEILRMLEGHPALEIKYPLDESVFPPEVSAPTFRWEDP